MVAMTFNKHLAGLDPGGGMVEISPPKSLIFQKKTLNSEKKC